MMVGMRINAQSDPHLNIKKTATVKFNMDIFSLLRLLEANSPLTLQKITDLGFELTRIEKGPRQGWHTASRVALNDGVVLNPIKLEARSDESGRHIYFLLNIKNKVITRPELERRLGKFVLLPKEHMIADVDIYRKEIGEASIHAIYTRKPENILLRVSFRSTEPLE